MSRPGFRTNDLWEPKGLSRRRIALMPMLGLCQLMDVWGRALLNLCFPPACVSCGMPETLLEGHFPLCRSCLAGLASPQPPSCERCGVWLPLLGDGQAVLPCPHCARRRHPWTLDHVTALGPYRGIHREVVLKMKRRHHVPLARVMGQMLADRCQVTGRRIDVVVPVPVHWRRRMLGTFDRCSLLAERVADRLGTPAVPALRCLRLPRKQGLLSPAQRRRNVANIFQVSRPSAISDKCVLLVDDVVTTGATACSAARMLRRAGATEVTLAVVARAMPTRGALPSQTEVTNRRLPRPCPETSVAHE